MDSDVIDDVNALLKLGVGDPYRLEHIKQAYMENKTIWESDNKYLQRLKEKYLIKVKSKTQEDSDEQTPEDNQDIIHCWKCGKKSPLGGNFCMMCGSSLFEVGSEHHTTPKQTPPENIQPQRQSIGLKIPIIIGIPVFMTILAHDKYFRTCKRF